MELSSDLWVCPVATTTTPGNTSFELHSISQHSYHMKQRGFKRPSAVVLELESSSDSEGGEDGETTCSPPNLCCSSTLINSTQLGHSKSTNMDKNANSLAISDSFETTLQTNLEGRNENLTDTTEGKLTTKVDEPVTKQNRLMKTDDLTNANKVPCIATNQSAICPPTTENLPFVGHSNSSVIDCLLCGRTFAGRRSLNIHLNKTHSVRDTNLIDLNSPKDVRKVKSKLINKPNKLQSTLQTDKNKKSLSDQTNPIEQQEQAQLLSTLPTSKIRLQKLVDSGSSPLCVSGHFDSDRLSNFTGSDLTNSPKSPKFGEKEIHVSKTKRTVYAVSPPAQSGLKIRLISLPSTAKHDDARSKSTKVDSLKARTTQIPAYSHLISAESVCDQVSTPPSTSSSSCLSLFLPPSGEQSVTDKELSNYDTSDTSSVSEINHSVIAQSTSPDNATIVTTNGSLDPSLGGNDTPDLVGETHNVEPIITASTSPPDLSPKSSVSNPSKGTVKLTSSSPGKIGTMDTTLRTKEGFYGCRICNRSFANRYSLTGHYKSHYEPDQKPYFCDDCGQRYTSPSNLHYHRGRNCPVLKLQAINEGKLTPSSVHNRKLLELKVLRAVERKALMKQGKQGTFETSDPAISKRTDLAKTAFSLPSKRPVRSLPKPSDSDNSSEQEHMVIEKPQKPVPMNHSENDFNSTNLLNFVSPSNFPNQIPTPNQFKDYFGQANDQSIMSEKIRQQLQTMYQISANNFGANSLFNTPSLIDQPNEHAPIADPADWKSLLLSNILSDPNMMALFPYLYLLSHMNMKSIANAHEENLPTPNFPGFRCPFCRYDIDVFRDSQGLDKHILLVHPEYLATEQNPMYKSVLPSKPNLTPHSSSIPSSKPRSLTDSMLCYAQSSECMKPAANPEHISNLVSCTHCDRGFSTYSAFRVHHTKTHQSNKLKTSRNSSFSRTSITGLVNPLSGPSQ